MFGPRALELDYPSNGAIVILRPDHPIEQCATRAIYKGGVEGGVEGGVGSGGAGRGAGRGKGERRGGGVRSQRETVTRLLPMPRRYCCTGLHAASRFASRSHFHGGGTGHSWGVKFVFGVLPIDTSSHWQPSPAHAPALPRDPNFNLSARESQAYLATFLLSAQRAPWRGNSSGGSASMLMGFVHQMSAPCAAAPLGNASAAPAPPRCCGHAAFPFEPRVFEACLVDALSQDRLPGYAEGLRWGSGVFFDSATGKPVALVLSFPTDTPFSFQHEEFHGLLQRMDAWSEAELGRAPPQMRGFFSFHASELYALQEGLGMTARSSTFLAALVAGGVLLLLTRNVLIALCATGTIVLIVATVTGILVASGWTLGIIESISLSCGIGMACDFVAHMGYAYAEGMRDKNGGRAELIALALRRMAPAVTAAALSTAAMGGLMWGAATVLTYQLGLVILLLMSLSWVFTFFFLLPLLALAGPLDGVGDIACRSSDCHLWPVRRALTTPSRGRGRLAAGSSQAQVEVPTECATPDSASHQ